MVIERNRPWGRVIAAPEGLIEVRTDAELARYIASGEATPVLVSGGDLHRSLGATRATTGSRNVLELAIDVLRVTVDGRELLAVSHVVVRARGWMRGPIIFVGNVGHLRHREIIRRGHPNDGRFEIVEVAATMSVRQRLIGLNRIAAHAHLSHPLVSTRTATHASWSLGDGLGVWVDGRHIGRALELAVSIEPDAATIHR